MTNTAQVLAPNITLIPAQKRTTNDLDFTGATKRVAAYCRVSTEEENQQNSYATQVSYYTDLITSNPEWQLVGIFADEGLSGTQTSKRTEFNKMIRLARKGKIDLILCKSISRFARNTVDCLDYVRELKALNINVKFEKENIETLSVSSEFAISLYASFAQAESESISKNVTWGIEKKFQDGKVSYVLHQTLGYRKGEDGKPVIIEEAQNVRMIFKMFADGYSMRDIAEKMTELGVKRRNGSAVWSRNNVNAVLINEKYVGDAVLQKSYTVDCLTHERAVNTGQKPKYLVQDCHPAIIDRDTWDRVRLELARRSAESKSKGKGKKKVKGNYNTDYCLNQLLVCPYCGSKFKRTIWKFKERNVPVWRCGKRLEGSAKKCAKSPSYHEDKIHRAIIGAINDMIGNKEKLNRAVVEGLEQCRAEMSSIDEERKTIITRLEEIDTKRNQILEVITGNSFDKFRDELKALNDEESELKSRSEELAHRRDSIQLSMQHMTSARELYATMEPVMTFDDLLIRKLVEKVEGISKTKIKVVFKGGAESVAEVEK